MRTGPVRPVVPWSRRRSAIRAISGPAHGNYGALAAAPQNGAARCCPNAVRSARTPCSCGSARSSSRSAARRPSRGSPRFRSGEEAGRSGPRQLLVSRGARPHAPNLGSRQLDDRRRTSRSSALRRTRRLHSMIGRRRWSSPVRRKADDSWSRCTFTYPGGDPAVVNPEALLGGRGSMRRPRRDAPAASTASPASARVL